MRRLLDALVARLPVRPRTGHSHSRNERGQSLVLFVLGLAVLLGFTALTVDGGLAYVERRHAQNAADASALAAADAMLEGKTAGPAIAIGRTIAKQNGYSDADADVSVTIDIPPVSGPHTGDPDYVEVVIRTKSDAIFARPLGKTSWDIHGRAVAGIQHPAKPYSIIALDPNACQSMQFSGQVSVTILNAGTFTNSECFPDAFYVEGSVFVEDNANDVVGGWVMSGGSYDVSPTPSRAGHYGDPLADVPPPTPIAGPVQVCPWFKGSSGTVTLQPGVYDCTIDPPGDVNLNFQPGDYYITGGIVIDGGGSATFGSGLYFLQGKGLIVTGSGNVTGKDVTFYIDEGQVVLTGTGDVDLTAPTSGPYEGIVIFQNRQLTSTVELSGNAITDGWGTVYAAGAQIHVTGNGTTGYQFIGNTFLTDGTTDLTIDFFGGVLASVPAVRLVE